MVDRLAPAVHDVAVVALSERRSEDPHAVLNAFRERVPATVEPSVSSALERWCSDAAFAGDVVVVAGSLFLVGEARSILVNRRR
jgi:folylpolyglutamate synthase/dihydropteroate synthase